MNENEIDDSDLLPRERSLVLVAEDEKDIRELISRQLQRAEFDVIEAADGAEAIELIRAKKPDAVLLDVGMPSLSGYDILGQLSEEELTTPILLVTAWTGIRDIIRGLDLGAHDHISKPFNSEELIARTKAAVRARHALTEASNKVEHLKDLASNDDLTGLYNRRQLDEQLDILAANATRYELPLSAVLVDIDNFKEINDRFGHLGGDAVLKTVASRIRNSLRSGDIAGRWGGDEFLIALPITYELGAFVYARRLCDTISGEPVLYDGQLIQITVSIGCAQAKNPGLLLAESDKALYEAKSAGRNCVMVSSIDLRNID